VAMAQFARSFFAIRRNAPVVDHGLLAANVVGLVSVVLIPLDYIFPTFPRELPILLGDCCYHGVLAVIAVPGH
jgi:hypothetical protein